jgi:hypothetical protein
VGYSVQWSGMDLVGALHENSTKILGRPYAMYVVALATEVDQDALDWLSQYGRAVDSLTGADVAFLTFCNSTVNHVARISKRVGYGGYRREDHLVDVQSTSALFHSEASVIEFDAGDTRTRDRKLAMENPRAAFVRSMTYESDSFARSLGLDLAELPCLVFFDDPGSAHYYVMSMNQEPGELIQRLRKIIGSYYRDAQGSEFTHCLSLLREIRDRITAVAAERQEIEQRRAVFAKAFAPEPRLEPSGRCIDRLAAMQARLADLHGQYPESPGWAHLVNALNDAWERRAYLSVPPKLQRLCDFAAPIRASIENETVSSDDAQQLRKLYNRVHKYLKEEMPYPATGQDWVNVLEFAASSDFAERCADARNQIARLQSALPEGLADIIAHFDGQLAAVEQRRLEAEDEQTRLLTHVQALARPSLEPTIRDLRWADRRERTRQFTSAAIETIARDPSFLLKVLALFRIGAGG